MTAPSSAHGTCDRTRRTAASPVGTSPSSDVELVDVDRGLALCSDAAGRRESVEIALVGPVADGDRLLVHAGTAIAHLGQVAA